jgi:hypothetical protein
VAEWQQSMSSREFAEWMAFSRLQPFGEWRKDYRIATLAAVLVNALTRTKDSDPVHRPEEFIPDFERALDEQAAIPEEVRLVDKVRSVFSGFLKKP